MSTSRDTFKKAIAHADRLIAGTKATAGKPTAQEGTMFVASVALTYAAWEAYVEDVAIEVTEHLAGVIKAEVLPDSARQAIEAKKPSTWDLAVHPGWQTLWKNLVREIAHGDASSETYGMNTANEGQTKKLFLAVGLDPFRDVTREDLDALKELVSARGTVVHTATAPETFKKATAKGYRELVDKLVTAVDSAVWDQAKALEKKSKAL